MSPVHIVGAYNTRFGALVRRDRQTGEVADVTSLYDLLVEAGRGALADAGVEARDVDGVWVGSCAPGLLANQEHLASFATEIDPGGLRLKSMTRCEAACASGTVALYDALYAIEAGRARVALVVGVEKMNLLPTSGVTHALATCSYWPEEGARNVTFPELFAAYADGYRARHGLGPEQLARMLAAVSALAYVNGVDNPLAHFGKDGPSDRLALFDADAILSLPPAKNPVIAAPLRLHDCSLVTDGAAAVVLARSGEAAARTARRAVRIAGIGHVNERLPLSAREGMHELAAAKEAARRAFAEARIGIGDVDLAEVHDCFTIAQLLCTEALGLSRDGRAGFDYLDGRFGRDDRCPVNLSGGLKAKGHPVGATGVSMHALLYKQLVGEPIGAAPARARPEIGVALNIGGAGVTNCVSVLSRAA